ncbi:MAG: hypothetical protein R2787_07530 [Saprospiraceae bacterium]
MVHILNGDALRERFPATLAGRQIVARECLVDGDVEGNTLEQVGRSREEFLLAVYGVPVQEYQEHSLAELKKIQSIPNGEEIALWFEDDLFCQVNLWFVCWLLDESGRDHSLYLVRPPAGSRFSFAHADEATLVDCFEARMPISAAMRSAFAAMWKAYQYEDRIAMHRLATGPLQDVDFLLPVIDAEVSRYRDETGWSPMELIVKHIILQNPEGDFPAHFEAFSLAHPIYGLGDLQFKRVWEEVNERM